MTTKARRRPALQLRPRAPVTPANRASKWATSPRHRTTQVWKMRSSLVSNERTDVHRRAQVRVRRLARRCRRHPKNLDGAKDWSRTRGRPVVHQSDRTVPTMRTSPPRSSVLRWGFMPGFCGADAWGLGVQGCLPVSPSTSSGSELDKPPLSGARRGAPSNHGQEGHTLVVLQEDSEAGRAGGALYDQLFTKTRCSSPTYIAGEADGSIDPAVLTSTSSSSTTRSPTW